MPGKPVHHLSEEPILNIQLETPMIQLYVIPWLWHGIKDQSKISSFPSAPPCEEAVGHHKVFPSESSSLRWTNQVTSAALHTASHREPSSSLLHSFGHPIVVLFLSHIVAPKTKYNTQDKSTPVQNRVGKSVPSTASQCSAWWTPGYRRPLQLSGATFSHVELAKNQNPQISFSGAVLRPLVSWAFLYTGSPHPMFRI